MRKTMIILAALTLLTACERPKPDLQSPCVGTEKSPCDRRAPANQS